jgi:Ca2+-binding EF-hand superfamily protein
MDRELRASLMMFGFFLLGTAPAGAQDKAASSFAALDKDKDGMISVTEASADKQIAAKFAAADKDQDGFLSRAEFDAIVKR